MSDEVFYKLPDDLQQYIHQEYEDGSEYTIGHRVINENRVLFVVRINPFLYNLVLCSRLSLQIYDDVYCYKIAKNAIIAMDAWNDVNEKPQGWFRHPATGMRREYHEDGTLKREWYQP